MLYLYRFHSDDKQTNITFGVYHLVYILVSGIPTRISQLVKCYLTMFINHLQYYGLS